MMVSQIVAAGEKNEIGKHNKLLWHLPNDLKFFKNSTWGMPVIMGRKTYESIAGEPLPGRFNIVVTSNKDFHPNNDKIIVVPDIPTAIKKAEETDCREVFIAGGGEIYKLSLPYTHRIYLTRVHHEFPEAEVFFPEIRNDKEWKLTSQTDFPADEKHAFPYSFETWEK
jgi:dihydrofolate reductase